MSNEFFVGKPAKLCHRVASCDGHCTILISIDNQLNVSSKQTYTEKDINPNLIGGRKAYSWNPANLEYMESYNLEATKGCSEKEKVDSKIKSLIGNFKDNSNKTSQ